MKQFNRAFFRDFWQLVRPYWFESGERALARILLAAVIVLNLVMVYISYRITEWYNTFWNALQKYDAPAAWHQLLVFLILVVPYIVAAVYQVYLTQMLYIRWRRWMTEQYLDSWLSRATYYHMQVLGDGTDNPDQRITEDLATFTNQSLNLVIGIISSITTLVAFVAMLWGLSGKVALPWHGGKLVIPGYLVWTALVYAFFGTIIVALVGRPLIQLNFNQERFTADFRFSLVRLRENSESIAVYGGEAREREHFLGRFARLFSNYWSIMLRTRRLNWWASGYGQAAVIFPVLVSMPAYFAKAIEIGTIMQISSAFGQVQGALSFIVNSYSDLASWHAVVDRLRFFRQSMERIDEVRRTEFKIVRLEGEEFEVGELDVRLPDGRVLIRSLSFSLGRPGRLLIMGPSGSGKSTLVRSLAGIWPFGEGRVYFPKDQRSLFLPQKPYLPLTSLRDVLLYPYGDPSLSDERIAEELERAGMGALAPELGESRAWSHILSLGEQQRLAFARILLQKPQWVFMDEASSALDEPAEGELYGMLGARLPETALVSVGHRSSLLAYHDRRLTLSGEGRWSLEAIA